jgi:hypothetical protein
MNKERLIKLLQEQDLSVLNDLSSDLKRSKDYSCLTELFEDFSNERDRQQLTFNRIHTEARENYQVRVRQLKEIIDGLFSNLILPVNTREGYSLSLLFYERGNGRCINKNSLSLSELKYFNDHREEGIIRRSGEKKESGHFMIKGKLEISEQLSLDGGFIEIQARIITENEEGSKVKLYLTLNTYLELVKEQYGISIDRKIFYPISIAPC